MRSAERPRTILHIINCLRLGGTETQLVQHLRAIDRTRWHPIVACLQKVGELIPELQAVGCDPIEFPLQGSFKQPNTALQAIRLARFIRREGAALVHAHDFYANLLAIGGAHLARRPVIVSQRDQGKHLRPMQRRSQGWARQLASRVLTNSAAVALEIATDGTPLRKVRVVPNGINLAAFDAQAAAEPPLPPWNGATVVVVANIHTPQKGHRELLDAAAACKDARFLLCGDGAFRPELERLVQERGLGTRVLFLGKRSDVPAILARADVLCHPSHAEGFPNAVLEALAARLPVVATRVGGIPDLVIDGEQGVLVRPHDARALAQALGRVLGDAELRKRMGEAGRARVERLFTSMRLAERIGALYDEMLGPPWLEHSIGRTPSPLPEARA